MINLRRGLRFVQAFQTRSKHCLPEIPFEYNALEPIICGEIMYLHHQKHHAAYVNNLNEAEEKLAEAVSKKDTQAIISLAPAIRFNGGGHINHSILWQSLSPVCCEPSEKLKSAINNDFGCRENLFEKLSKKALGVRGSGWAWLAFNPNSKKLELAECSNQDPLEALTGLIPLFGIDVWEHAYYIQYKNDRECYVRSILQIANWTNISQRFEKANSPC